MRDREARIQFAQERRGSGDSSSRLPHKAPPDVEKGIRRDIHTAELSFIISVYCGGRTVEQVVSFNDEFGPAFVKFPRNAGRNIISGT